MQNYQGITKAEAELFVKEKSHCQFEQALCILENRNCILGMWLKGRVYQTAAENIANSFIFQYYCNDDLMGEYRMHLKKAEEYFNEAGKMLYTANAEIKDFLNQMWQQVGWCQNEQARTKPWIADPEEISPAEEFKMYKEDIMNSLVNDMEYFTVN